MRFFLLLFFFFRSKEKRVERKKDIKKDFLIFRVMTDKYSVYEACFRQCQGENERKREEKL